MNAPRPTLAALAVHPVKSCAALAVDEARLVDTGLEWDREWMLVDEQGVFVTQRELPRLALVQPALRHGDMRLRAPGMLALHLSLDVVEAPARVRVWNDEVAAYDMGDLAAQWFSDFTGRRLRLVRFDPEQRRACSSRWCGDTPAQTAFADGYPLLVLSRAAVDALNARLAARGAAAVDWRRFRPNLLIDGLEPHGEDWLASLTIDGPDGPVVLKPVKPCARCPIPNVDPDTGVAGTEPGDTLAGYRADARLDGAVTFGMNAIVVEGEGRRLRVGSPLRAEIGFD